jgi:oligopeptide transport system substrate-binding protein
MHSKRFLAFALLIVAAMLFSACAAPAAPAPAAEGEAMAEAEGPVTLRYNIASEPPSLDPSLATDTTSINVINELFLGLTELDPDTQEATPMLATSWEANEDQTVWTFTLRDDVPWVKYDAETGAIGQVMDADGNPRFVTAGDIVYSVQRTCNAETASDYAYVLYVIAGCEAANTGEGAPADVGVVAIDDATVQFTLNYGAGFFPQIASMWVTRPLPQWDIDEYGDLWTEPGNMSNNGPFVLAEWIHNDSMRLERNPDWFGWTEMADVAGNLDVLELTMIEEISTEFAMFENNELDSAGIPLDLMERALAGDFGDNYVNAPRNCTYYYGFVTEKEGISDVNVRRALSMAVDRTTLVDRILKGGQIEANAFTNPLNYGSPAGNPEVAPWALPEDAGGTGYEAAVAMAKEMMSEAGYPDGAGLDLTIGHNVSEAHAQIAQAIQAMWTAAFPEIEINIETQEWGVYLESLNRDSPLEGKPDVFRLAWCADYPHANNWIHEVFNPEVGNNEILIKLDDPQIGDAVQQFSALTQQAQTASPEEQLELYKQAEKLFIEDIAGIIPIYFYTTNVVQKPWLDRVYSDNTYFYRWSIDPVAQEGM